MSTFCFDNYTHMNNEDLISCTYKPPKVYFESWNDPYEGLAPDEDSVIVVRDKYITKYTRLKCAKCRTENEVSEITYGDVMTDCSENRDYFEDLNNCYEYAVEEYDTKTYRKRKYKVILEQEEEVSIEDYFTMGYFAGSNKLGSYFNIKDGVLSRYFGNDKEIYIPDNVTEIAVDSFRGLEKFNCVVIPKTVVKIPCGFCRTEKLEVDKDNPKYYIQDGCLIDRESKELVWAHSGNTIPDDGSVVKIGSKAFYNRADLSKIVIPDVITEIGDEAFAGFIAAEEIVAPDRFINDAQRIFGKTLQKDGDKWIIVGRSFGGFSF